MQFVKGSQGTENQKQGDWANYLVSKSGQLTGHGRANTCSLFPNPKILLIGEFDE